MIPQFAGRNPDRQLILFDRERTRRELRERARRVICTIEIEIDRPVLRQRGVQESARLVGLRAARQIREDEKQVFVFRRLVDGLQSVGRLPSMVNLT